MSVREEPIWLSGIIPVLVTPFTERGEVDVESFDQQVEDGVSARVNGLAMFGLASEYYKLSATERTMLTGKLVRRTAGRVPVVISVTNHATELAVEEARAAEALGADAVMVLPPFFLHPALDQVLRHLDAVAAAVGVPVVVQYAPLQTGMNVDSGTFAALHKRSPNITHIKVDLLPSGPTVSALRQASQGCLGTLTGYMGLDLPEARARGADGCMPTLSVGRALQRVFESLSSDPEKGRELHYRLLPLLQFMMQSVEMLIACEKFLLLRRGIIASAYCRHPSAVLDSHQAAEMAMHSIRLSEVLI